MEWFKPQFPEWWTALLFYLAALGREWNTVFDHYTWVLFIKKTHIFFPLSCVFSFQGWFLTLRWEFCNLHQQKLLQGKFGKVIGEIDSFSESQRTMKTWSWTIQVEGGTPWDHASEENSNVDMKSWKNLWVHIEAALESGLYHSGTLDCQVQNNVISWALSGSLSWYYKGDDYIANTALITHSFIHLSFHYLNQSCIRPCALCFRYRNGYKIVSSLVSVQPQSKIMCQ